MGMLGERALYYTIHQYLSHYHAERKHQGLGNQLIAPDPGIGSHRGEASRPLRRVAELLLQQRGVTRRYFSTIRLTGSPGDELACYQITPLAELVSYLGLDSENHHAFCRTRGPQGAVTI